MSGDESGGCNLWAEKKAQVFIGFLDNQADQGANSVAVGITVIQGKIMVKIRLPLFHRKDRAFQATFYSFFLTNLNFIV